MYIHMIHMYLFGKNSLVAISINFQFFGSKKRWPEEEDLHLRKETDAFGQRILPSLRLERSELTMRCPYDQHLYADEVGFV